MNDMTETQSRERVARDYIALWNETDAARRTQRLGEAFLADVRFADPLARVAGREALGDLIGSIQSRFPGFRFTLKGADGYGETVRLSWTLGPEGGEAPVEGTDVLLLQEGRIESVIGFFDRLPG